MSNYSLLYILNKCILFYKKKLLEGCTTNVLFVSNNKIYSPVKNIYEGTTLKFFKRKIKVINKKERIGRNPKTKMEAIIVPRKVVTFKPSLLVKEKLNNL